MGYFYEKNKTILNKLLLCVMFLIFIYLFVNYILEYVSPFLFAFLFALILEPIVDVFEKRLKFKRGVSAIICIIILIVTVIFLGTYVVEKLRREVLSIIEELPSYIRQAQHMMKSLQSRYFAFKKIVPIELVSEGEKAAIGFVGNMGLSAKSAIGASSIHVISSLPKFVMWMSLCILSTFFFIKDKYLIRKKILENCPLSLIRYYGYLKRGILGAIGGYFKAQAVIMSVIAIINILFLIAFGYTYPLFMGIVIAFFDALPVIGSGIIILPWCFGALIIGEKTFAISLLILYGVNFLTRQLLEPKVLSAQMGIYPIVMLMSVYAGVKMFGTVGFLIGPTCILILKILYSTKDALSKQ